MWCLLVGVCGCAERAIQPFDPANPPPVVREHVAGAAAAAIGADGRFVLPDLHDPVSEIGGAKAQELAVAYLRTFGALARGTWEAQRGGRIALADLRPCGRVTYAMSPYASLPPERSLWARKLVGSWWLVIVCGGSTAEVLIAVAAANTDVSIGADGRLVQPGNDGNNFITRGIPVGESVPISPEEAVTRAAEDGGEKVADVPTFVMRPRPSAPWLGVWRIGFLRPVSLESVGSQDVHLSADAAVGYSGSWAAQLLVPAAPGATASAAQFEDHGISTIAPPVFEARVRTGVPTDYIAVRRRGDEDPDQVLACSKGGGNGGGSNPPDPRPCQTFAASNAWTQSNSTLGITEPRSCPYTTSSVGKTMPLWAIITANREGTNRPGVTGSTVAVFRVASSDGQLRHETSVPFTVYDSGSDRYGLTLQTQYPSGYGSPVRDSVLVSYGITGYGLANAYALLPGKVDASSSGGFIGATSTMEGVSNTWRVVPLNDTVSYTYLWRVDGQPVSEGAALSWTFGSSGVGDHEVSVEVIKSDFTSYTVLRSVYVAGNCGGIPCP